MQERSENGNQLSNDDAGAAVAKQRTAPDPDDPRKPDSPPDLEARSWKYTLVRSVREFLRDNCTNQAAALTYYAVLAIFPALVALFSLLGLIGQGDQVVGTILDIIGRLGQPEAVKLLDEPLHKMAANQTAGVGLVIGLAGAIWSATGYTSAFAVALNQVYEVDEGRPFLKLRPQQLLITVVSLLIVAVILVSLVVSGPVADAVGSAVGLGETAQLIWSIAKWPVVLIGIALQVALLYYFTPNVQQPKFRWVSVGAVIAIVAWIVMSVLFGLYVANFGSYDKTYGSLAGVVVFLLWLWLTNVALLFGAEVDAELERSRQLQGGIKAEKTLQLPPRSTQASAKAAKQYDELVAKGRLLRESLDRSDRGD